MPADEVARRRQRWSGGVAARQTLGPDASLKPCSHTNHEPYLAEFLSTTLLIIFGNGVANVLLSAQRS